MARRNISLPDDLDEQAREAQLNVSALAQRAITDELDRQRRMARLDSWLDELDTAEGAPSAGEVEETRARIRSHRRPVGSDHRAAG